MARIRLATRAAAIRLAVFLGVALLGLAICHRVMIRMPGKSYDGPWMELTDLERKVRDGLQRDIDFLAAQVGARNVFQPGSLSKSVEFLTLEFAAAGYKIESQSFQAEGETCVNLEAVLPGRTRAEEIIVIGAHYDTVGDCPGANDNATGVGGMLALARLFAETPLDRTLRWVAFVNEEPPFFQTEQMGSLVYARRCRDRGDQIIAMLSLETIGFYSDAAGSQRYPFPIGLAYPSTGNFIGFVGDVGSSELVRRCVAAFRGQVRFPSEGAALPAWLPGIGWSDHWSFWQAGYPALMVTDTATFRYPHYHLRDDTPEKLDYDRMARVVCGLATVVRELAGSPSGMR